MTRKSKSPSYFPVESLLAAGMLLQKGAVGVLPTDTIYGVVASALDERAVNRVYELKGRNTGKPCIVLIADIPDLNRFGVTPDDALLRVLTRLWPGAVSVILDCPSEKLTYLHRGLMSLAFRLPSDENLRALLRMTGPLIAPSANPEGRAPAGNIEEAKTYFGERVDFYVDGGTLKGEASTLVRFRDGKLELLRQGAVRVS